MTREEKLKKAHQMFDNRNLITELKWQREYFRRGYISNQEELFNIWIFDECIKALEQESKSEWQKDHEILKAYSDGANEILDKIRAEIAKYGSIMVSYAITKDTKTDKGIEKLVSDVLKEAKEQVLEIIDKYKGESEG